MLLPHGREEGRCGELEGVFVRVVLKVQSGVIRGCHVFYPGSHVFSHHIFWRQENFGHLCPGNHYQGTSGEIIWQSGIFQPTYHG